MMALLLGLLRTDLLAREMSAVTRVIEILQKPRNTAITVTAEGRGLARPEGTDTDLPSNLCLRKSKSAFCIMSVTCTRDTGRCTNRRLLVGGGVTAAHLVTFERRSHQNNGPHGGNHIVRGDVLHLATQTRLVTDSADPHWSQRTIVGVWGKRCEKM